MCYRVVECVIHCGGVRGEGEGGSVMCVIRRTQVITTLHFYEASGKDGR